MRQAPGLALDSLPQNKPPNVCKMLRRSLVACVRMLQLRTRRRASSAARTARVSLPDDVDEVGYVTDVEGDFDYFLRYARASRVLHVHEAPDNQSFAGADDDLARRLRALVAPLALCPQALRRIPRVSLRPGKAWVFGGDLFDRGAGDLRLLATFLALRAQAPDRVFWLAGNRDLNKIRLSSELAPCDLARHPSAIPEPYWVPRAMRCPLGLFLQRAGHDAPGDASSAALRVRHMLGRTMGAPHAFALRGAELALLTGAVAAPDDAAVAQSFASLASPPDGALHEYLRHAHLGLVLGASVFVHGAVDAATLGRVPGVVAYESAAAAAAGEVPVAPMTRLADTGDGTYFERWLGALNAWLAAELAAWARAPTWDAARWRRGGEGAIGYSLAACTGGRTVVYNCLLRDGQPMGLDAVTARQLRADGLVRLVAGHQPFGDVPLVMRDRAHGVYAITADISRADAGAPDARGRAVAEVVLQRRAAAGDWAAWLHGQAATGERYHVCIDDDALVGARLSRGWWVGVAAADGRYDVRRGAGFAVERGRWAPDAVRAALV